MTENYLLNPENLTFFVYDELLKSTNPDLVEISAKEVEAIRNGSTWNDIQSARSGIVNDLLKKSEEEAKAKLEKEMAELDKEDHSVNIVVDKKSVANIEKENEQRGEPDEFGETKRIFENLNTGNVTLEDLIDVKNEELHTFSRNVLKFEYNPVPEDIDDEQKELFYASVRADIEKRISDIVLSRGVKDNASKNVTLGNVIQAEKEVAASEKKRRGK